MVSKAKYLLRPTFFNIFLERTMSGAQEDLMESKASEAEVLSVCGLPITQMLKLKKSRN